MFDFVYEVCTWIFASVVGYFGAMILLSLLFGTDKIYEFNKNLFGIKNKKEK